MTFLTKIGKVLLTVLNIATGIGPILKPVLPPKDGQVIDDTLTKIGGVVALVESAAAAYNVAPAPGAPPLTGVDKLRMAVPLVSQAILTSEMLVGKKIKNEDAWKKAATNLTSAVADLLNAYEG